MDSGKKIELAEELKALAILLEAVSNESFGDGQYDFFSTSDLPADILEWRNERLSPALNSAVTRCRAIRGLYSAQPPLQKGQSMNSLEIIQCVRERETGKGNVRVMELLDQLEKEIREAEGHEGTAV